MKYISAWWPAAIYLLLMFTATSIPHLDTSEWPQADKVFHLAVYAVWAYLCMRGLHHSQLKTNTARVLMILAGLAVAALDELHESFIPDRTVSLMDFLFNAVGFMVGTFLGYLRFVNRRMTGE